MDLWDFYVEPFITYWNIGKSNTVTGHMYLDGDPNVFAESPIQATKSQTTEIGARIGVDF